MRERSFRRFARTAIFAAVLVVIGSIMTSAVPSHSQEPKEEAELPVWRGEWTPPEAKPGGWDWVRVSSNEWVKGEILLMRDFELEFDSDEFGVVSIDWEDVSEVLTERIYTVVLEDMKTAHTGTMSVRGDQATVKTAAGLESFDRALIIALVPDTSKELRLWSVRGSAGVSLRSGNTESSDLNGSFRVNREDRNTSTKIEYSGIYGSLDSEKNTNTHRGSMIFDYFLTRDFFLTPAAFEVFSDEFQNVSYRLTPSAGVGYYLVRKSRLDWEIRAAVGYQYTRIESAPSGDSKTSDNAAGLLKTSIDAELSKRIDLLLDYQIQIVAPDTDATNHHGEATLEIELTSAIDLDVSFVWDRIEDPEPEADGERPDTDDFRTTIGLAIEY
jgi:putative salt-induced outer membrane protein YdiY